MDQVDSDEKSIWELQGLKEIRKGEDIETGLKKSLNEKIEFLRSWRQGSISI